MICPKCNKKTLVIAKYGCCLTCLMMREEKPKRQHSKNEERIQIEFFNKVRLDYPELGKLLFAVPNGGSRNVAEAANLKKQGVTSGVSDAILLMPNKHYHSLCIEFKAGKGKQSDEQKEFEKEVSEVGNMYVVCRSADEGIETLKNYINER